MTKELRKELYRTQYELSEKFPDKPNETADLSEEIEYSQKLIEAVKKAVSVDGTPKAKKSLSKVEELLKNDKIKEIQSAVDEDAKLGYKSEHNSFFGYKNHIAMTEERIITGLEVTTGEAPDGGCLERLVEQSEQNGIAVEEVAGDTAYSSKSNLKYAKEKNIKIIAKLNPVISNGNNNCRKEGFMYNKDADTYQCKGGFLAERKAATGKKEQKKNQHLTFYFDVEKCKNCPLSEGCYKAGAKSNTYSVLIQSDTHKEQQAFQESEYFKERAKQRYMIEAKNAELKQAHGLEKADSVGIIAMRLQSYFTAFVANVKRIVKLLEPQSV